MQIGVKLPNSGPFAGPEAIKAIALEAEHLGYASVWVHDHVHRSAADAEHHFVAGAWEAWERPVIPNVYEALSTLLYVAGFTSRVLLGTSIIVIPLRHPVWLAKMAATLDQLSNGRLILGVGTGGTGYIRSELMAIGEQRLIGKVGKVANEWIDIVRAVWREPKLDFKGEFIDIVGAEVFPKPLQKYPPIWIAGKAEPAQRRTALRGDGWLPMFKRPQELVEGKEKIDELAARAGRDPGLIKLGTEHWLAIDRDANRARERSAKTRYNFTGYMMGLPTAGADHAMLAGTEDTGNLVGDPQSVLDQVAAYKEVGVDHLNIRLIGHSLSELIEVLHMFKESVMDPLGVTTLAR